MQSQALLPEGSDPFYLSESFFTSFFDSLTGVFLSGLEDSGVLALTPDRRAAVVVTDLRIRRTGFFDGPYGRVPQ